MFELYIYIEFFAQSGYLNARIGTNRWNYRHSAGKYCYQQLEIGFPWEQAVENKIKRTFCCQNQNINIVRLLTDHCVLSCCCFELSTVNANQGSKVMKLIVTVLIGRNSLTRHVFRKGVSQNDTEFSQCKCLHPHFSSDNIGICKCICSITLNHIRLQISPQPIELTIMPPISQEQ